MRIAGVDFTIGFFIGAALGYWAYSHYKATGKLI